MLADDCLLGSTIHAASSATEFGQTNTFEFTFEPYLAQYLQRKGAKARRRKGFNPDISQATRFLGISLTPRFSFSGVLMRPKRASA
jgi:hypothetical protein